MKIRVAKKRMNRLWKAAETWSKIGDRKTWNRYEKARKLYCSIPWGLVMAISLSKEDNTPFKEIVKQYS